MDIPFPPNYGGIIDVFFKLKAFHQLGVKIYLHVFGVSENGIEKLKEFSEEVYFYPIKKNPIDLLSSTPFSIKSRKGKLLLENLRKIDAPIFFESFRTMDVLNYDELKSYKKYLRLHNIEHNYFNGLAESETNFFKQKIYQQEAEKYKKYEKIISQMNEVFTLSNFEQNYIHKKYNKGILVPVFNGNSTFPELEKFGKYILYHGDLRTADNCKVVEFLIDVFKESEYQFVIASGVKEDWVRSKIGAFQNIQFVKLKDFNHLLDLFKDAHINIAWSFQESGTKLKVVNALFNSRFSLINQYVIDEEKIAELCYKAETAQEILYQTEVLMQTPFLMTEEYKTKLNLCLNDLENAKIILDTIFMQED